MHDAADHASDDAREQWRATGERDTQAERQGHEENDDTGRHVALGRAEGRQREQVRAHGAV
jgi:hypothetical protein